MSTTTIDLGYRPKPWQDVAHRRKRRFSVLVWHRGAGKTAWAIAELVHEALTLPPVAHDPRRFAYVAPLRVQAQDVAWNRLLAYVEPIDGVKINKAELAITLPNGSIIQLYGADNPDRLRGITLDGAVLDEVAQMPPMLFREVLLPALNRPGRSGWCVWIGTPKGRNEFHTIYERARLQMLDGHRDWFADIQRQSDTRANSDEQVAAARLQMTPEEFAQEYECDWNQPNAGHYYAAQLLAAERENRVLDLPHDPRLPVVTAWDLGVDDATAIWFIQAVPGGWNVIDYEEHSGEGADFYARILKSKPYAYDRHHLPHDVEQRSWNDARSRRDVLESLGVRPIRTGKQLPVADGINAVRMILPRCKFNARTTQAGLKALWSYRRQWNDQAGTWRAQPLHDWSSHGADAFREFAMNGAEWRDPARKRQGRQADNDYDPMKW